MKKVFSSNSDLIHAYNLQEYSEGNVSSWNLYFEYTRLYSYGSHYLLCEFIDENTVMINNKGYSNSTAKHINICINATSNRKQFFWSNTNLDNVNYSIKEYLSKLTRSRKYKDMYKRNIVKMYNSYIEYLKYTKQLTKYRNYPKHREILKLYKEFTDNLDNLEETIEQQEKRNKEIEQKRIKVNLKKWRNLEIDYFRNRTGKDYLRYIPILEQVQTTQGIKVNLDEVKRLCKLIDNKNAIGSKVNDSYLITACNGIFKAGCHNIDMKEINLIRKQINI